MRLQWYLTIETNRPLKKYALEVAKNKQVELKKHH